MSNINIRQSFFYGASHAASASAPLESLRDINPLIQKLVNQLETARHFNANNQEGCEELQSRFKEIVSINNASVQSKVQPAKEEQTAPEMPEPRKIATF